MYSNENIWNSITSSIERGDCNEALEMITRARRQEPCLENNISTLLLLDILKSRALLQLGNYHEAIQLAERVLEQNEELFTKTQLKYHIQAVLAESFQQLGRLEESQAVLNEMDHLLQSMKEVLAEPDLQPLEAMFHYLLGRLYFRKGQHDDSQRHLEQALMLLSEHANLFWKGRILKDMGSVAGAKGDYAKAKEYLREALELFHQLGNKKELGAVYNNLGVMCWSGGDVNKGLQYYTKAQQYWNECGYAMGVATTLNNMAMIHAEEGQYQRALDLLLENLQFWRTMGNKQELSRTTNNIGILYRYKGELFKALTYQHQALELQATIGNDQELGELYHEIARLHHLIGNAEEAKKHYELASSIRRKIGNPTDLLSSLFWQLVLEVESRNLSQTQAIYSEISALHQTMEKNQRMNFYCALTEAYMLKQNRRLETLAHAQQMFRELADQDPVIDLELTAFATFNFWDLLLLEVALLGNESVFEEVHSSISRLEQLSSVEHSILWLSEIHAFKARLEMFNGRFDKAITILSQVESMINKYGIEYLKPRISNMVDDVLILAEQVKSKEIKPESLEQRLQLSHIMNQINDLATGRLSEIPEPPPEDPLLLVITSVDGLPLLNKILDATVQADEMLIGGFLSAINSFGKEIFSKAEALDRVLYKNHTILFRPEDHLLFCYVFKGHTHSARKKLERVVTSLQKFPRLWDELQRHAAMGIIPNQVKESLYAVLQEIWGNDKPHNS